LGEGWGGAHKRKGGASPASTTMKKILIYLLNSHLPQPPPKEGVFKLTHFGGGLGWGIIS